MTRIEELQRALQGATGIRAQALQQELDQRNAAGPAAQAKPASGTPQYNPGNLFHNSVHSGGSTNNFQMQQLTNNLDLIPTYGMDDAEKQRLAYDEARRLGMSADDVDKYYGFASGTTAGVVQQHGWDELQRADRRPTPYTHPELFEGHRGSFYASPAAGTTTKNYDGSFTTYQNVPGSTGVGGQTYNPDGSIRDPGGPRQTLNQVLQVQRNPDAANNRGPAWAQDPAALQQMAGDLGAFTPQNYNEMRGLLSGANIPFANHFAGYLPANGGASRPSATDGLNIPMSMTPPSGGSSATPGSGGFGGTVGQTGNVTGNIGGRKQIDPSSRVGAAVHSGGTTTNADGVAGWQAPQFNPTETVEARLNSLLEDGNPMLEHARKRALEEYAGRGLLNSSMAQQGAMNAMVQTALPIASADAAAINNVGMFNTELQSKAAQDYAAALNNWNTVQQALSKDQHSRYQDTLSKYQTMYQTEYNAIMMAENIDAATKDAMLGDLESRYTAMYNSTNAIFSRAPGWQQSWLTVFGG